MPRHGRRGPVGRGVVGLIEGEGFCPVLVGPRPGAPAPAGRRRLVEDEVVAQQELRHPLLGALQVVARVLEVAREVARRLGVLVWDPHLDDVAARLHARQPLGVAAVVLAAAVGRGPVHLRDRPDDAAEADAPQRAATVGGTTIVARPTKELQGEGLPMFNSYRLYSCPGKRLNYSRMPLLGGTVEYSAIRE